MFIDTHCHLDRYEDKLEEILANAKKAKVEIIVANGTEPKSNRFTLELSKKHKEVKAALGLYPIEALSMSDKEIGSELNYIKQHSKYIVAIGEVGIDLKESEDLKNQEKNFQKIIDLAKEIDKPLIIHSRKAEKELIEILEKNKVKKVVMHCFSGKFSLVDKILANGWTITIPTSVKNSEHFQKIIEKAPLEQLLCETDSPWLHPDREFPNQPANVIVSYQKIAEIKKIQLKKVQDQLQRNFANLFK